ncbi:hydroxyacid dehydrogenase [Geomicrobium sp. JCM 19055]|uniref:hydroxyacid dehydrogenase n=1 Tax=Geomicrobium sp. JCM 19055 TaxID=1460649 RepID=UPI00045ED849|nr:hydroxyacid dehydrogenase [Geomicrobium sp. JCM 19055]GAK01578.1 D-3-phosphoglycerate dehydrogenase [Geomicrobium sp. JCM 19055]
MKVLVPQPVHADGIQFLKDHGLQVIELENDSREEIDKYIEAATAILVRTTPLQAEQLERGNKLQVIARHGVGLDLIDTKYCEQNGIKVCNTPVANVNSVAEHVTGFLLSIAHRIPEAERAIRRGNYESRHVLIGQEVKGKTLGLIGFGNIAQSVAKKCALGLGMNVIAYDPYAKEFPEYVEQVKELETIAQQSHFVSVHVPLNDATENLIDRPFFHLMQSGSYLINAARGGIVNETALTEAIDTERIAGAALDCYAEEPIPLDFPLKDYENVLLTPHMAAHTEDSMRAMALGAAEAIVRAIKF